MHIKNLSPLPALAAGLGLILAAQATAQTFTTLHSFTNGTDGSDPKAGLILSSNTLYGTALGGDSRSGTVFAVNTDGTGFTTLDSFTDGTDGAVPKAGLILSGNTLYGTAESGNIGARYGTVFAVNTDGSGFSTLHVFTYGDGAGPAAGLTLSGNALYGTTLGGGSSGWGTVFEVNADFTGFATLYSFTAPNGANGPNGDGAMPKAGLILSSNTLYGTASGGGSSGRGTVFSINVDGTGFTNLHNFSATTNNAGLTGANSDGSGPAAGLALSSNTLYGTAFGGGTFGNGTVFSVNTDGTGFTTLHSFTAAPSGTNSDGSGPAAGLVLSGNILYGTASGGGSSGNGTVFVLNTDGTGFTTLHTFTATINGTGLTGTNSDGSGPVAGLVLSGNTLYGTASGGGSSGNGTVFSLSLPPIGGPQVTISISGANVVLTWPTNAAGFILQSTTNLVSPPVWTTNSPAPVVVNGQNTVTNLILGAQQFYRLSQ